MALTEADKAELVDNQFVYDGSAGGAEYVRHLPCDTGIYLGEPQDVQKALEHLSKCPTPDGPADTFRGQRPWPEGSPAQEAKKEEWLSRIKEHTGTTDKDYAAAVTMLVDPLLPVDPDAASRLEAAGFVIVNPDGTCAAVDAWWAGYKAVRSRAVCITAEISGSRILGPPPRLNAARSGARARRLLCRLALLIDNR